MLRKGRIFTFFAIVISMFILFGFTIKPISDNIKLGLDLQGGFEVLYQVEPAKEGQVIDDKAMEATVSALDKRVNALGVNEPNITIEENNQIRVQLAGVTDQEKARELLSTEANLTFRDYQDNVVLDGQDLVEGGASVRINDKNQYEILLELKDADKFGQVTSQISALAPNNQMIIWLDFEEGVDSYAAEKTKESPKFISDPYVAETINSDTATISGNFTKESAQDLADILNAGALPVKLTEIYSTSVGAQFGEQALHETVLAGIIALLLVFAFMIYFYRFPGVLAAITLTAYCYFMILIFEKINGVLTLPGIAALILGIGIAVDANIISDERIKDELKKGRSVKAAFKEGNKHSLSTIIDAHVTTFIVGVVLFIFGTSSVKGFATMLIISIVVGFCTAVFGTRAIMALWVKSNFLDKRLGWWNVKEKDVMKLKEIKNDLDIPTKFDKLDFIKHGRKFFIASGVVTVVGIVALLLVGLNTSIDFSSGSRIQVNSDKNIEITEIENKFEDMGLEVEDAVFAGGDHKSVIVRTKGVLSKEEVNKLTKELDDTYGQNPNISTVSPTVGKALAKNALKAVVFASIGILLYVTLRFEWRMAVAAIISLLHDAFFIVTVFSITRLEVDVTFIAAVLTIIGYSINDTIVTFDRIRENMHKLGRVKTKDDISRIANISIRQTLKRSINTVVTVILTVLAMLIFGSQAIFNFNFALLVGLVIGMYSSVLIAVPIWVFFKKKEFDKRGPFKTVKEKRSEEGTV